MTLLVILHVFWGFLIVRMIYNTIFVDKTLKKDIRSSDEEYTDLNEETGKRDGVRRKKAKNGMKQRKRASDENKAKNETKFLGSGDLLKKVKNDSN